MCSLIFSAFRLTSNPATEPDPLVGERIPHSIRIVVDLPAPLGPRKPKISPFFTSRLTWSTATKSPNFLVMSLRVTAGSISYSRGFPAEEIAQLPIIVPSNGHVSILPNQLSPVKERRPRPPGTVPLPAGKAGGFPPVPGKMPRIPSPCSGSFVTMCTLSPNRLTDASRRAFP